MEQSKGAPIRGLTSRFYDRFNALFGFGEPFYRRIVNEARLQQGEKVLDCGCGTGTLALIARRQVGPQGDVYGVDISEDQLQIARRKAQHEGLAVDFRKASIDELPFPAEFFDVIYSSIMLHHVPRQIKQKAFQEMRRVLKPGGRIIIADFGPPAQSWEWVLFLPLILLFMAHGASRDNVMNRLPDLMSESGLQVANHSIFKRLVHIIRAA